MKICIACEEWEYEENKVNLDWGACPNCDFPYKFTGWIEELQNEIKNLQKENNKLSLKLTKMVSPDEE